MGSPHWTPRDVQLGNAPSCDELGSTASVLLGTTLWLSPDPRVVTMRALSRVQTNKQKTQSIIMDSGAKKLVLHIGG